MKKAIATARKTSVSKVIAKRPAWRMASLLTTSALVASGLVVVSGAQARAAVGNLETPTGGQVVGGSATISLPQAGQLDINQTSNRTVINWDTFNIGQNATTQFYQPGSGSLAVNRVIGAGEDPAQILGTLKSNGQVMVLDRNGVLFGQNAVIDVGGIVASTGDIDTEAVMRGDTKLVLSNFGSGSVINNATINVADAGLAAFVSPFITNNGVINVKLGKVAFGSGSKVTLDLYGDSLLEIAVNDKAANALIKQAGTINAQGGSVLMTAQAAKGALDDVINMSGVVNVSSATVQGGKIVLSGGAQGAVTVAGSLNASGATGGGSVSVTGQNVVVADTGNIDVSAKEKGDGGSVYIYGDEYAILEGAVTGTGGSESGNGGSAEVSAGDSVGFYGDVDLSAANGESGTLLIDPEHLTISNASFSENLAAFLSLGIIGGVNINDQALANALHNNNVNLWASSDLSVTTDIDISKWQTKFLGFVTGQGITGHDLTLAAPTVNLTHNVILGTGKLNLASVTPADSVEGFGIIRPITTISTDTVNLNGLISTRSTLGGTTALAGDAQINSTASTINVVSPNAKIQQGISLADKTGGVTVNVSAGTYNETVQVIGKSNLSLKGAGQGVTIIKPTSTGGAPALANGSPWSGQTYTPIVLAENADNDNVSGLTIDGTAINGNASGTNTAGLAYYNAGGTASDLTITNAGAFGFYAVADGTQGHIARVVAANNITASGNWWAALAAIGNQLTLNVNGGNYSGAGASEGLDLSNGSHGTVTNATISTGTYADKAGIGFHGGHDWTISGGTINGGGAGTTGIADDGAAYGAAAASNIAINGTNINNVDTGVAANGGSNWDVNGGTYTGTPGATGAGVSFVNLSGSNNTVNGLTISGFNNGVFIDPSPDTIVSNNIINNTTGDGIVIKDSTGAQVLNNQVGLLGGVNSIGSGAGGGDGIFVTNSDGTIIQGNSTANTHYNGPARKGSGILVTNSDGVTIGGAIAGQGNDIALAGSDGIVIRTDGGTADHDTIQGNTIHGAAGSRTGIYTEGATNLTIADNSVSGSGRYAAIYVNANGSGHDASITGNILNHNGEEGILVQGNGGTNAISGNTIDNTGESLTTSDGTGVGDAIHVQNTSGLAISGNQIGTSANGGAIRGDGIYVSASNGVVITGNETNDTRQTTLDANGSNGSGIQVVNTDGVTIGGTGEGAGNTITNSNWDGIRLQGDQNVNVTGNSINNVTRVGIWGGWVDGATIANNSVLNGHLSGYGEIHADYGSSWTITGNTVADAGSAGVEGIFINYVGGANLIDGNHVDGTAGDGINSEFSSDVTISNNKIGLGADGIANTPGDTTIGGNGIEINYSTLTQNSVLGNTVDHAALDGILVDPPSVPATGNYDIIEDNNVDNSGKNGIESMHNSDVTITGNTVNRSGNDGIFAVGGVNIKIGTSGHGNIVDNSGNAGIDVTGVDVGGNAGVVSIAYNTINGTAYGAGPDGYDNGHDGIVLHDVNNGAVIDHNNVNNAGDAGIDIQGSSGTQVTNNNVDGSSFDGITTDHGNGINIQGNTVTNTHGDSGVAVHFTTNATVDTNTITNANLIGVYGDASSGIKVTNNTITNVGTAFGSYNVIGSGVAVEGANDVTITGNTVSGATGDGINAGSAINQGGASGDTNVTINNNTVSSVKGDGIHGASGVLSASGNTINSTGGDGIDVANSAGVVIGGNHIGLTGGVGNIGGDGINLGNSAGALINSNTISNATVDGIYLDPSDHTVISLNTITGGLNGIAVDGDSHVSVFANTVNNASNDGIYVDGGTGNGISQNHVNNAGVVGIYAALTDSVSVAGNFVTGGIYGIIGSHLTGFSGLNGNNIDGAGTTAISIWSNGGNTHADGNTISNTGGNGPGTIDVEGGSNVTLNNNGITNSVRDGVYASGVGTLSVTNNTINGAGSSYNGGNGIEVLNGTGTTAIGSNTIDNVSDATTPYAVGANNGIYVSNTAGLGIGSNKIGTNGGSGINGDGINVQGSAAAHITGNTVANISNIGIYLDPSNGSLITANIVAGGLIGIQSVGNSNVTIGGLNAGDGNTVTNASQYGIEVGNGGGNGGDSNKILGNNVSNSGTANIFGSTGSNLTVSKNTSTGSAYGIEVSDLTGASSVDHNIVAGAGADGIYATGSSGLTIGTNTISGLTGDVNHPTQNGIELSGGANDTISGNTVDTVSHDGIDAYSTGSLTVSGNKIKNAGSGYNGGNGIEVANITTSATISGNIAYNVSDAANPYAVGSNNGILANNAAGLSVSGNWVGFTDSKASKAGGANNINGNGIDVISSSGANVSTNHVTNTAANGIEVDNSNTAVISGNAVQNAVGNGIYLDPSSGVVISGNTINTVGVNGIYSLGNDNVTIGGTGTNDGNTISNTGANGILVDDTGHAGFTSKILKNKITAAANDGIQVLSGSSALIDSNSVTGGNGTGSTGKAGAGRDGIHVESNNGIIVSNNTVSGGAGALGGAGGVGAVNDAIYVKGSNTAQVLGNTVSGGLTTPSVTVFHVTIPGGNGGNGAGNNGVELSGGTNGLVDKNTITGGLLGNALGAVNDGIHVDGNQSAKITNNSIYGLVTGGSGAGRDGINVNNSGNVGANNKNGVTITGNTILGLLANGAGRDGIHVTNSAGKGTGSAALIDNNSVTIIGNDGIFVDGTKGVKITNNTVTKTGDEGIESDNSDNALIQKNTVTLAGGAGVLVDPSSNTVTDGNTITLSGSYGVQVVGGINNTVSNNTITLSGDDGVRLDNNALSKVTGNTITLSKGDGVEVNGGAKIFGFTVGGNTVDGNTISLSDGNGVNIHDSVLGKVTNNTIALSGLNGIDAENVQGVEVDGNKVALSGNDGIYVDSSALASIDDNTVAFSANNGIEVGSLLGGSLSGNTVAASGNDGISLGNGALVSVDNNGVALSGNDGIDVGGLAGGSISGNTVAGSANDGIALGNGALVSIDGNWVALSGNDGINVGGLLGGSISDNTVGASGNDGIALGNGVVVSVDGNTVLLSANNGIEVGGLAGGSISGNTVGASGNDGISLGGGALVAIDNNGVALSGNNGIEVGGLLGGSISDNTVVGSTNDGITLGNGALVAIDGNGVALSGNDGIEVGGLLGGSISGNTVAASGNDGIALRNAALVGIDGNIVTLSGHDGIFVDPSAGINIASNFVSLSGHDGIHAEDVLGLNVEDNTVLLSGHNGIDLNNVLLAAVHHNIVAGAGHNGIDVTGGAGVGIFGNLVSLTGNDGILADCILGLDVSGNIVALTGGNGIEVENSGFVLVGFNAVGAAGGDGILLNNTTGALVAHNLVGFVADNGIEVDNSSNTGVEHNFVTLAGNDGIHGEGDTNLDIGHNLVTFTGNDGVDVSDSNTVDIHDNGVAFSYNNGIEVNGGDDLLIEDNNVSHSGNDGIYAANVGDEDDREFTDGGFESLTDDDFSVRIIGNNVDKSGQNGIEAYYDGWTKISQNDVTNAREDGIYVNHGDVQEGGGDEGGDDEGDFGLSLVQIDNNTVNNVGDNGIQVVDLDESLIDSNKVGLGVDGLAGTEDDSHIGNDGILVSSGSEQKFPDPTTISNNKVSNAGFSGIEVNGVDEAYVLSNVITNSGANGFFASGPNNGLVVLAGNTFNNNPVGAKFESGTIDLTGATNFINGGEIGLQFIPYFLGFEDGGEQGGDEGGFKPLVEAGGTPIYAPMRLVDNTIGTTTFTGQSTYYVDLENGAFFDPGKPTILNGLNATYDGLRPSDTDGLLTLAQYDALEAKIHHYIDDQTLGLFFFGFVPDIDQSDIFHHIKGYQVGPHGFHVTVNGLPPITGNGGNAGGLANIEPAAGGDGQDVTDAGDAANIEPAAGGDGGQPSSCWTQVISNAAHGVKTTYSFGDSLESQLAGAAGCGG